MKLIILTICLLGPPALALADQRVENCIDQLETKFANLDVAQPIRSLTEEFKKIYPATRDADIYSLDQRAIDLLLATPANDKCEPFLEALDSILINTHCYSELMASNEVRFKEEVVKNGLVNRIFEHGLVCGLAETLDQCDSCAEQLTDELSKIEVPKSIGERVAAILERHRDEPSVDLLEFSREDDEILERMDLVECDKFFEIISSVLERIDCLEEIEQSAELSRIFGQSVARRPELQLKLAGKHFCLKAAERF